MLQSNILTAESLGRELGAASAPVLAQLEEHSSTDVRRSVVEIAGLAPGVENCRLLVRRTAEPDVEVRDLAALQLPGCKHREILPELLQALERAAPQMQGAMALQVAAL